MKKNKELKDAKEDKKPVIQDKAEIIKKRAINYFVRLGVLSIILIVALITASFFLPKIKNLLLIIAGALFIALIISFVICFFIKKLFHNPSNE